jgi:DNA replication protein DnaC
MSLPVASQSNTDGRSPEKNEGDTSCSICQGAGWLANAVPLGHPLFGVLTPCACTEAERARRRKLALYELSNLAPFHGKTFASFNVFVPGLRPVVPRVLAYAQQPDGWLSLLGPYGVGKTHLAAAIAHEVLARDEPVLFVVAPDLLDHLRTTFGPQSTVSYDERFTLVRDV